MPIVPTPDECELEEDRFIRMSKEDGLHPAVKSYYIAYSTVSSSVTFYPALFADHSST